jgi:hypothetical protein
MDKKIIPITAIVLWCFGCVAGTPQGASNSSRTLSPSVAANTPKTVGPNDVVFDPVAIDDSALPDLRDLPFPGSLKNRKKVQSYTGIIRNKTRYEVSVPSSNSDATLVIPAYGWIEYTAWLPKFNLTAYHNGKPFYCLNIFTYPKAHPYMCKKYDFMAEIIKEEPLIRERPIRKKRSIEKKPKCKEGVEALG